MDPDISVAVALGAFFIWALVIYNRLVALRNRVANALAQIDVQLKRRHDLIPNLVETARGYLSHEKETLEAVISARNKAVNATGIKETAAAEGALTGALTRFFAIAEAYPDLKSNQNVLQLQEELTGTENKIGFSRQAYNDVATTYNTVQMQFPTNLVAGLAKAVPADLWEIEDAAERNVPKVDLGFGKPSA